MVGEGDKGSATDALQHRKKQKDRKKKSKDAALDALKSLPLDQQIDTLLTKYSELSDENSKLLVHYKTLERSVSQCQKEKDKAELDLSKAVLARSRLESLCRELQKQNKQIKEYSASRLKEEEDRRKEVSNQFSTTFTEISRLMEENTTKNSKLREENQDMASRLQELIDQHKKREDHVDKAITQKKLEAQLSEAKLAKAQIEFTEEKEKWLLEKKTFLVELSQYQKRQQEMAVNEVTLRTQLNSYTEKYEEFQGTLEKSNQIFKKFKKEMDEMNKIIKRHEKESKTWKDKWENANRALLQMVNERSQMEAKIESQGKQNTQLQSLCRALQQQTTELRVQLKNAEKKPESPVNVLPCIETLPSIEPSCCAAHESAPANVQATEALHYPFAEANNKPQESQLDMEAVD